MEASRRASRTRPHSGSNLAAARSTTAQRLELSARRARRTAHQTPVWSRRLTPACSPTPPAGVWTRRRLSRPSTWRARRLRCATRPSPPSAASPRA
eukprot:6475319-Prymnesium_polylepis.1